MGRYRGHGVERGHHGGDPGRHRRFERRQIVIVQLLDRDIDRVVVTAALRPPVSDIALGAGRQFVLCRVVLPLVAADLGHCHSGSQVRILAAALGDPPPARFVGHVHHRCVGPGDPAPPGLGGGGDRITLRHLRIEAGRLRQGDREVRGISVDDVETEDERAAQPGVLHRQPLQRIEFGRTDHREHAAARRPGQRRPGQVLITDELQLTQLLGQCHPPEQGTDPALGSRVLRGRIVMVRPPGRRGDGHRRDRRRCVGAGQHTGRQGAEHGGPTQAGQCGASGHRQIGHR